MKKILKQVLFSSLTLLPSYALAVDGVLEINQTCAMQLGCFSGDAAGYPVTIDGSAGNSYRLTSSLVVPDQNLGGIFVNAPSISIDLNGFEIVRSGCDGATTNCTPTTGSGNGVEATSTSIGISLRSGSVTGFRGEGILISADQAIVEKVRVRWNGFRGIVVGRSATLTENVAYANGEDGIRAVGNAVISGNAAYQNGEWGIVVIVGAVVTGNSTYSNGRGGIFAAVGSTVTGNTSFRNMGDGISVDRGNIVQSNVVRDNDGYGLRLGVGSAYRENVITANTLGTVLGGVNLLNNSCNNSATCP